MTEARQIIARKLAALDDREFDELPEREDTNYLVIDQFSYLRIANVLLRALKDEGLTVIPTERCSWCGHQRSPEKDFGED